jgi:Fur family ferric uptake transcriptional regulator
MACVIMEYSDSSWLEALQETGYRLTGPRCALVKIMANSQQALSPIDLYDQGRKEFPGLGLVTVYRTLEKLEDLGLVQRVHQPRTCRRYLRAAKGHEHLLICSSCGQAEYFHGDDLTPLMDTIARQSRFQITDHWLQLFGLCPACQAKSQAPMTPQAE